MKRVGVYFIISDWFFCFLWVVVLVSVGWEVSDVGKSCNFAYGRFEFL